MDTVEQTVAQPVTTQQTFDPSQLSRTYTHSQWLAKEDWYAKECNGIHLNESPTPAEIQKAAVRIDTLLSMARIDYAYVNQMYDRYSMQLKIEEKRLFVDLKITPPTQYNTLKLTVDEMKGVVASIIQKTPWAGTKYSLYQLVEMSSNRNIFMEGVIKILQDKKDLLITHSGMLKIESSLNSLSPNAIPGQYHQGYKHSMED
jgi:hypothetical protein